MFKYEKHIITTEKQGNLRFIIFTTNITIFPAKLSMTIVKEKK